MTFYIYTPQPMSLPSINFLYLTVSKKQARQTSSRRLPTFLSSHPDTMNENNTLTALKGCGITRPTHPRTNANLYPPERQLAKASEPSFDQEGGDQGQICPHH